eukprot:SAG11_NODE_23212_length_393_cov_0.704082_1_plen_115_part_10
MRLGCGRRRRRRRCNARAAAAAHCLVETARLTYSFSLPLWHRPHASLRPAPQEELDGFVASAAPLLGDHAVAGAAAEDVAAVRLLNLGASGGNAFVFLSTVFFSRCGLCFRNQTP